VNVPKNPNHTELRDGHWYSIVLRYPRAHHHAKWVAAQEWFVWQGTSETKIVPLAAVDEILHEVDPAALDPAIVRDLV
jgi:hypothetical protein